MASRTLATRMALATAFGLSPGRILANTNQRTSPSRYTQVDPYQSDTDLSKEP